MFNHVSDDSVYFDRYYKFLGKSEKIGAYPYWAYVYDAMAEQGMTQAEGEAAAVAFFGENYGITDFSYTEWAPPPPGPGLTHSLYPHIPSLPPPILPSSGPSKMR